MYKRQRPDSAQGMMLKQQMNAYLQRVYTYQAQFPNETLTQIKQRADADLKVKSKMQLSSGERINMKVVTRGMYFNYMSYVLLAKMCIRDSSMAHNHNKSNPR